MCEQMEMVTECDTAGLQSSEQSTGPSQTKKHKLLTLHLVT